MRADAAPALARIAQQLRETIATYPGPLAMDGTAIEASVRLGLAYALAVVEAECALSSALANGAHERSGR